MTQEAISYTSAVVKRRRELTILRSSLKLSTAIVYITFNTGMVHSLRFSRFQSIRRIIWYAA